ncbi:hypothetical protein OQA88_7524 [Cercophora sp. LCS_1]
MKSNFIAAAVAVLGSTPVLAQTPIQSDPFFLKIVSSNSSLDGRYLYACHTGAATETLCLGKVETPAANRDSATFYWNTTSYDNTPATSGVLIWNLKLAMGSDGTQQIVPSPMTLQYNPGTNVATTWFSPGYPDPRSNVGFNNSALFVDAYPDDSTFRDGQYPSPQVGRQATSWYACWIMAGSYYYEALAWVTSGEPRNPTCRPVSVVKESQWIQQQAIAQPAPSPEPSPTPAENRPAAEYDDDDGHDGDTDDDSDEDDDDWSDDDSDDDDD